MGSNSRSDGPGHCPRLQCGIRDLPGNLCSSFAGADVVSSEYEADLI